MTTINTIRNFAVIAHIDHGKSTLCDRLIEACGAIDTREMKDQILDSMDIERERGITIKAQTAKLRYLYNGVVYTLNLIDTPGHVDFSYEVSRSLAACEGSLLVLDVTQGIQAQTLANVYKAIDNNHEIIPVLNKIDLPAADPEGVKKEIEDVLTLDTEYAVEISAKTGFGIDKLLEAIILHIPAPKTDSDQRLKALLIDSWYDPYLGIVILVRVKNGVLKKGMSIRMMHNGAVYLVDNVGIFTPKKKLVDSIPAGDIGFFTASIKELSDCKVGDTITDDKNPVDSALTGFKSVKPVVFCGFFPISSDQFDGLKTALHKLNLNDSSFIFEPCSSSAIGYGFRCGFLGMLHLEVVHERLCREFDLDLVITAPSVTYRVYLLHSDKVLEVYNANDMPDPMKISHTEEPWIKATIIVMQEYLSSILDICNEKRGIQKDLNYIGNRVVLVYELPLAEVVYDFYDRLKSSSRGYASFDWEMLEYRQAEIVKLTILVNFESVDALTFLLHKQNSERRGRELCERLKDVIPRQQIKIAIQASIGAKVIARETIAPFRKDVTAKLYGGDRTRRMKLLEKQKKGKRRMQTIGSVEVPQSAFIDVLKIK